jgi:hypothetical protein
MRRPSEHQQQSPLDHDRKIHIWLGEFTMMDELKCPFAQCPESLAAIICCTFRSDFVSNSRAIIGRQHKKSRPTCSFWYEYGLKLVSVAFSQSSINVCCCRLPLIGGRWVISQNFVVCKKGTYESSSIMLFVNYCCTPLHYHQHSINHIILLLSTKPLGRALFYHCLLLHFVPLGC